MRDFVLVHEIAAVDGRFTVTYPGTKRLPYSTLVEKKTRIFDTFEEVTSFLSGRIEEHSEE